MNLNEKMKTSDKFSLPFTRSTRNIRRYQLNDSQKVTSQSSIPQISSFFKSFNKKDYMIKSHSTISCINSQMDYQQHTLEKEPMKKTITQNTKKHYDKYFSKLRRQQEKEIFLRFNIKKQLKGRLQKLINASLLFSQKKNIPLNSKLKMINPRITSYHNLFPNTTIRTNQSPNLIGGGMSKYSRFDDHFMTPDELVFMNFTDQEIEIMRSDPSYFMNKNKELKNLAIFKNKNLTDVLNDEENTESGLRNIRTQIIKTCRKPVEELQATYFPRFKKDSNSKSEERSNDLELKRIISNKILSKQYQQVANFMNAMQNHREERNLRYQEANKVIQETKPKIMKSNKDILSAVKRIVGAEQIYQFSKKLNGSVVQ